MNEDRQPVHMLIADLTRPDSIAALEEFAGAGEVADRIRALRDSSTHFVAVLVGSAVAVLPLPTLKDLVSLQRVIIDLAVNLGIVAPVPLGLDYATHRRRGLWSCAAHAELPSRYRRAPTICRAIPRAISPNPHPFR